MINLTIIINKNSLILYLTDIYKAPRQRFMKKALTILTLFVSIYSYAQQDPYYTHFKDVMQAYNPAAAGHKYGEICLSGLTHHQWRDYDDMTKTRGTNGSVEGLVEDVAPVTYNFNVGTVFKLDKAEQHYLGAGISVIDDQIGFTKSTAFMANLNYRKVIQARDQELRAGIGIGGTQWGWDEPKYVARQQLDPNIPVSGANQMKFDLNFGLMFKQKRLGNSINDFYAGFSMTNLNQANYSVNVTTLGGTQAALNRKYVPHYYTVVGGDIPVGGFVLEPAILAKYGLLQKAYVPQVDINVTALFANTFRGGVAFRQWGTSDALSLLLGYEKGPLEFGYSYDVTLSNVQLVSNGTHEIMVKYCIPFAVTPPTTILRESVRFL